MLCQWNLLTINANAPMTVTIYHNPDFGTSRNTLALIRHVGIEATVIECLNRYQLATSMALVA